MPTYHFHIDTAPTGLRGRLVNSFIFTVVWLLCFSSLMRLVNGRWDPPIPLAVGGAVFFLLGILSHRQNQRVDLEVDDYGIRSFWNGKLLREVRSDRVQYVCERSYLWRTRLVLSEQRTLPGRFFHCVVLPKRATKAGDYEQVKALALHWLKNSGA